MESTLFITTNFKFSYESAARGNCVAIAVNSLTVYQTIHLAHNILMYYPTLGKYQEILYYQAIINMLPIFVITGVDPEIIDWGVLIHIVYYVLLAYINTHFYVKKYIKSTKSSF